MNQGLTDSWNLLDPEKRYTIFLAPAFAPLPEYSTGGTVGVRRNTMYRHTGTGQEICEFMDNYRGLGHVAWWHSGVLMFMFWPPALAEIHEGDVPPVPKEETND